MIESVPPRAYGGTERVVHYLTEALVEMGHEVTLFASGDSSTHAKLVPIVDRALRLHPARPDPVIWHTLMVDRVHLYSFHARPQDYFAFVGRISPEKRCDRAIEIAIACNTPLRIAAKVDSVDRAYFEQQIEPMLDHPLVTFVGEIDDAVKNDFVGHARALLMPIDWPEPFGLVIIEALACGTPVIAYGHGSVPELLAHGETGFIVHDQEQAIAAARDIARIDRAACRAAFERRFCARVMAENYLAHYRRLIDQRIAA